MEGKLDSMDSSLHSAMDISLHSEGGGEEYPQDHPHEADMFAVDALADNADERESGEENKRGREYKASIPHEQSRDEMMELTSEGHKLVLAMVGLPARGKSFIARKIKSYLNWRGLSCRIFNAGRYRRRCRKEDKDASHSRPDYFDTNNKKAVAEREKYAMMAMEDMLNWFSEGGEVGIFDATNTTRNRRARIVKTCRRSKESIGILFIESICDEEQVIDNNIRCKVTTSPDFEGMDIEDAIRDIKKRIERYQARYETIMEDNLSYIKLYNLQSRVFCNRVYGRIGKALLQFLMAIHIGSRRIVLVRAGEAKNANEIFSGGTLLNFEGEERSAHLSESGRIFARHLSRYMAELHEDHRRTEPRKNASCLPRTKREHDQRTIKRRRNSSHSRNGSYPPPLPLVKKMSGDDDEDNDDADASRNNTRDPLRASSSGAIYRPPPRVPSTQTVYTDFDDLSSSALGENDEGDFKGGGLQPVGRRRNNSSDSVVIDPLNADGRRLKNQQFKVMTSLLPVAMDTAELLGAREEYASLMPLHRGVCGRDSLLQSRQRIPRFYNAWITNPIGTKWPGGESYDDARRRIVGCLIEIEQQPAPVVVVSHIAVLQLLYAYFTGDFDVRNCYTMQIPMHTAIILEPLQGGSYKSTMVSFDNNGTTRKEVDIKHLQFPPPISQSAMSGHQAGGNTNNTNNTYNMYNPLRLSPEPLSLGSSIKRLGSGSDEHYDAAAAAAGGGGGGRSRAKSPSAELLLPPPLGSSSSRWRLFSYKAMFLALVASMTGAGMWIVRRLAQEEEEAARKRG